jgi:hypothetical protein
MAPLSHIGNVDLSMAKQQDEGSQFGLHQNPLNGTIDTAGNTQNFGNDLKEQELMVENLEVLCRENNLKNYIGIFSPRIKRFMPSWSKSN